MATTAVTNANNRVFYAVHSVGMKAHQALPITYNPVSGVQSVGINTTFNLDQVFQLGQLDLYENIENIPDVEVTIEKVLDGMPLIQHLSTPSVAANASGLSTRYGNSRTDVAIAYYDDTQENAVGNSLAVVMCSGMYMSSINMSFNVDGNATESVTLVGNDKFWEKGVNNFEYQPPSSAFGGKSPNSTIRRRQHIQTTGIAGTGASLFPRDIPGIRPDGAIDKAGGARIQSITTSVDLGRSELFELGTKGPYHRFAEFPTEVTCAIEVIEPEFGDFVEADSSKNSNVNPERIYILVGSDVDNNWTIINLGNNNKLSSITSSGGDTGGGNRSTTYNYSNFNFFTVVDSEDVAGVDSAIFN